MLTVLQDHLGRDVLSFRWPIIEIFSALLVSEIFFLCLKFNLLGVYSIMSYLKFFLCFIIRSGIIMLFWSFEY